VLTPCCSKSVEILQYSIRYSIITSLLEVWFYPGVQLIHTAISKAEFLNDMIPEPKIGGREAEVDMQ
jgi:hypothetical protein